MGTNPEIEAHLVEIYDELFAVEMPLADRPIHATVLFAKGAVLAVGDGKGGSASPPEAIEDLVRAPWFANIFKIVHQWYAAKYGEANLSHGMSHLRGFVNIRGAPFAIHVPAVTTRVEDEGRTAWMIYPVGVQDAEVPLDWIMSSPDLSQFADEDVERLRQEVVDQASALRQVNAALTGTGSTDAGLGGLLVTIRKAIEHAADIGATARSTEELSHGYWPLQVACECALKAVRQVKEGTFRRIHDLGELYDDVALYGMPYERATLDRLPRWQTTVERRYAQGAPGTREEFREAFRLALTITAQTLDVIVSVRLGGAGLLLARPPWFASIDEDAA